MHAWMTLKERKLLLNSTTHFHFDGISKEWLIGCFRKQRAWDCFPNDSHFCCLSDACGGSSQAYLSLDCCLFDCFLHGPSSSLDPRQVSDKSINPPLFVSFFSFTVVFRFLLLAALFYSAAFAALLSLTLYGSFIVFQLPFRGQQGVAAYRCLSRLVKQALWLLYLPSSHLFSLRSRSNLSFLPFIHSFFLLFFGWPQKQITVRWIGLMFVLLSLRHSQ